MSAARGWNISLYKIALSLFIFFDGAALRASANPNPPAIPVLDIFDARPLLKINVHDIDQRGWSWDRQQALAALQGIANRDGPGRIYIYAIGGNEAHRSPLAGKKLRKNGQWLADTQLHEEKTLEGLIEKYAPVIHGIAVWDERVPATALVAATAAGADDLLPVRFDPHPKSLYTYLTSDPHGPNFPVRLSLINPDGSPMFTDASHWRHQVRCCPLVHAAFSQKPEKVMIIRFTWPITPMPIGSKTPAASASTKPSSSTTIILFCKLRSLFSIDVSMG